MYTAEDFYEAYSCLYKTTKEEAIEVYENCSEEFAYETICRYRYPDKYPFQVDIPYQN